jgi:hypothetical protein
MIPDSQPSASRLLWQTGARSYFPDKETCLRIIFMACLLYREKENSGRILRPVKNQAGSNEREESGLFKRLIHIRLWDYPSVRDYSEPCSALTKRPQRLRHSGKDFYFLYTVVCSIETYSPQRVSDIKEDKRWSFSFHDLWPRISCFACVRRLPVASIPLFVYDMRPLFITYSAFC